jgi:hypothetical protein
MRQNTESRGAAEGSEATAMVFGEYFPNPGGKPLTPEDTRDNDAGPGFRAEVRREQRFWFSSFFAPPTSATATRPTNPDRGDPSASHVTLIISLIGPLTMALPEPGARFCAAHFFLLAGWGSVPFTANGSGWLTVYIIAPIVGGLLGGGISGLFSRCLPLMIQSQVFLRHLLPRLLQRRERQLSKCRVAPSAASRELRHRHQLGHDHDFCRVDHRHFPRPNFA